MIGLKLLKFQHIDAKTSFIDTHVTLYTFLTILIISGREIIKSIWFKVWNSGSPYLVRWMRGLSDVTLRLWIWAWIVGIFSILFVFFYIRSQLIIFLDYSDGFHALLVFLTIYSALFNLKIVWCSYMKRLHL